MSALEDQGLLSKQRDYWYWRAFRERGFPPPTEWLDYKQHQPIPTERELAAEAVEREQRYWRYAPSAEVAPKWETKLQRFRKRLEKKHEPSFRSGYIVAANGPVPPPLKDYNFRGNWWDRTMRCDLEKAGLM